METHHSDSSFNSTSPDKMVSQNINNAILKAEVIKAQFELAVQFKKNLAFFKSSTPRIYEEYRDYEPKEQKLYFHEQGYVSLLNIATQNPSYSKHPKSFASDQVNYFLKQPTLFKVDFKPTVIWNDKHIHVPLTNEAMDRFKQLDLNLDPSTESPIGLVVMVGCGMGYQIEELIKRADVRNLYLYDSNKDSFFASLHTADWEFIVNTTKQKGGSVKLVLGKDEFNALTNMRLLTRQIGLHNCSQVYIFNHTHSEKNSSFIQSYRKDYHLNANFLGFFDDEQIGLAHTVSNVNKKLAIFNPVPYQDKVKLPPAFVIGNGPSLDALADTVRKYQENAIIFSCGTSISSLYKLGIKPDYQVEIERGLTPCQWIKMGTDAEFRKGITLLALNTVSPHTIDLFDETLLALKPNDLGANLIEEEIHQRQHFEHPFCNPTATNSGLAFAIFLGFQEIYLIGTDLGIKKKGEHHSKHSIYNRIDEKRDKDSQYDPKSGKDYTYSDTQYMVKGNFCDEVETITSLDMSRRNIEICLEKHPNIVCHNPNDGAFIRGTQQTRKESIDLSMHAFDKQQLMHDLKTLHFQHYSIRELNKNIIQNEYLEAIFAIRGELSLPKHCTSLVELYESVENVFKHLETLKENERISYMMVKGSIQVMLTLIYYYASKARDDQQLQQCYQIGHEIYTRLIDGMYKVLAKDPLRLDDSRIKNLPKEFEQKIND